MMKVSQLKGTKCLLPFRIRHWLWAIYAIRLYKQNTFITCESADLVEELRHEAEKSERIKQMKAIHIWWRTGGRNIRSVPALGPTASAPSVTWTRTCTRQYLR